MRMLKISNKPRAFKILGFPYQHGFPTQIWLVYDNSSVLGSEPLSLLVARLGVRDNYISTWSSLWTSRWFLQMGEGQCLQNGPFLSPMTHFLCARQMATDAPRLWVGSTDTIFGADFLTEAFSVSNCTLFTLSSVCISTTWISSFFPLKEQFWIQKYEQNKMWHLLLWSLHFLNTKNILGLCSCCFLSFPYCFQKLTMNAHYLLLCVYVCVHLAPCLPFKHTHAYHPNKVNTFFYQKQAYNM